MLNVFLASFGHDSLYNLLDGRGTPGNNPVCDLWGSRERALYFSEALNDIAEWLRKPRSVVWRNGFGGTTRVASFHICLNEWTGFMVGSVHQRWDHCRANLFSPILRPVLDCCALHGINTDIHICANNDGHYRLFNYSSSTFPTWSF